MSQFFSHILTYIHTYLPPLHTISEVKYQVKAHNPEKVEVIYLKPYNRQMLPWEPNFKDAILAYS